MADTPRLGTSVVARLRWLSLAALWAVLFSQFSFADSNIPKEDLPTSWQADADLTDVFFLNRDLGWAVGGQGVVLRTVNGGKDWLEISQASQAIANEIPLDEKFRNMRSGARTPWTGVADGGTSQFKPYRCRFESVQFVDEQHGWIAGGYDVPYIDRSRAVVLRTNDGGVTWRAVQSLVIPRIKRIHFSDLSNGWAIGEMGNLFRTGIYYSSDGGQTWSSQSSGEMKDWIDGEQAAAGFVNIDSSGQPGVVRNNRYETSVLLGDVKTRLNKLRMVNAQQGWAVGSGGAILHTSNGGLSWSEAVSAAEKKLFRNFDFNCISLSPGKIWFTGNPGSLVFSVDLKTGDILAHRTGIQLPIHGLHFIDDQTGWLVGTLGNIIATTDGGQTWQVQRGIHRGLAVLGVATDENELPLEMFADLAGEENRVCGAAILGPAVSAAAKQAAERLGVSTTFSVNANESSDQPRLESMVRAIRTLRPNVIVCNSKFRTSSNQSKIKLDPELFLIEAIQAAADGSKFPEQITDAALENWQVDRLAMLDATGTVTVDPGRMLPRTGSMVEDRIAISRALIGLPLMASDRPSYRVQNFSAANSSRESDLMAGIAQMGRVVPTREKDGGFRGNLNAIQLATSKHKRIEQFANFVLNTPQDLHVWNQQVLSWILSLDEDVAGIWLAQLSQRYLELGKTELAAYTMELLATRMSEHALSPAALTWLVQYYASDEMGLIAFRSPGIQNLLADSSNVENSPDTFQSRPTEVDVNGVSKLVWVPVKQKAVLGQKSELDEIEDIALASHNSEAGAESKTAVANEEQTKAFFQNRWQLASQFLSRLSQRDPDLVVGSQYRIIEAQINRKLNGPLQSESLLKLLVQLGDFTQTGISTGAQRELVIGGILLETENPLHAMTCQRASVRPRLDGKLDDDVWNDALERGSEQKFERTPSESNIDDQPDLAMFAFDDQFLYAAFRCRKLKGQYYQTTPQPRPRDPDLTRRDRVEFSIDVDRDYRSANQFVVDYRGWAAEGCAGSKGWDPTWFVSRTDDADTWTIELAIPLEQIVPGKIKPDSVWAVRFARRAFDSTNLWDANPQKSDEVVEGLHIGFLSQPAHFELMRFK